MYKLQNTKRSSTFAIFFPLKIFLSYLIFTYCLAVFGPIDYYMFPVMKTSLFIGAVSFAILFGYIYGSESNIPQPKKGKYGQEKIIKNLIDVSLAISLLALLFSVGSAFLDGTLNTDFSAIGDSYVNAYEGYERNSGNYSLSFILYSVSLPFNFIASILGFYYFFSLNASRKLLVLTLAGGSVLFYVIGSGKQKQLGEILIYLSAVAMLKYGVRRKTISLKFVIGVSSVALLGLLAFVAVLGQRYLALGVDAANINTRVVDRMYYDTSHPIFLIFGTDFGLTLSIFLSYLSQGYYGLGLALETDWQWTHFMGFSYSVSVLTNRIFGVEWEWPNTLFSQVGLTTGWGDSKWHTVFTHFATDFTFPGTVILFGFFSYVYARCWISAIRYENPFSILLFSLMTLGAFFIPANNQLFHSPGSLFTTILVSGLYMGLGRRFNLPEEIRHKGPVWRGRRTARRT